MPDAFRIALGAPVATFCGSDAETTFNIDAANPNELDDKCAGTFQAPEDITVTELGVYVNSVTGTPPTYIIQAETIAANGAPSGTLHTANASGTFTPTAAGWNWVTLTSSFALSMGDEFAIVVEYSSGTQDGTNFAQFTTGERTRHGFNMAFPLAWTTTDGGTTWSHVEDVYPNFGFRDASSTFGGVVTNAGNTNITNATERGVRFNLNRAPFGRQFQIAGVFAQIRTFPTASEFYLSLYDSDGTTVLQQKVFDTDLFRSLSTGTRNVELYFEDTNFSIADLDTETDYYIGFATNQATSGGIYFLDVDPSNVRGLDSFHGGDGNHFVHVTRTHSPALTAAPTDGGPAWTVNNWRTQLVGLIMRDMSPPKARLVG